MFDTIDFLKSLSQWQHGLSSPDISLHNMSTDTTLQDIENGLLSREGFDATDLHGHRI